MRHWKHRWASERTAAPDLKYKVSTNIEPEPNKHIADRNVFSPSIKPERRYLNTEEAALYLGLSRRTLERYRVEGTGPQYLKAGPGLRARVYYRIGDIDAWLEADLYSNTSQYGGR